VAVKTVSASPYVWEISEQCGDAISELQKLRPVLAGRLAEHALQTARQHLGHDSCANQLPAVLLAESLYEQGRLEEADNLLRFRLPVIRSSGSLECAARAYAVLARVSMHTGQRDFALSSLRDARALGERRCWPRLVAVSTAEYSQILLEDGDLAAAADSIREFAACIEESTAAATVVRRAMRMQLALLEFRLAICRGAGDAVAPTLTRLFAEDARGNCDARWTLQLQLQLAAAHLRGGREFLARDLLTRALEVGAGNGLCMSFIDAGALIRGLIATLCREPAAEDPAILDLLPYIRNLLRHINRTVAVSSSRRSTQEVSQSLTRRESGILQLIANGLSNKRIAQRLDITPETVKSHAKNIFCKLAAQTRAQAVARAEALGII
jgi:ATP/maltotriose-dependent transcriptional regulator MalT